MAGEDAGAASALAPEPSLLTAEFWSAARREVLVRPVCGACGRSFFVPQAVCTYCLSAEWAYEPSGGRGVVYSATVAHRSPVPAIAAPFHLAIVDLESEGWSMLTNLEVDQPTPVTIGTPVQVAFRHINDHFVLPVFVPERGDSL